MRLVSPWTPRLSAMDGRPYERLVTALAEDIAAGTISSGDRLPPHRELSYQLKIGLGTVTKAYATLERRGLVQSIHGRGMFVAGLALRSNTVIDLSINTPPQMLSDRLLASTLTAMAKRLDAGMFATYAPPAGRPEHRALMARWLAGQRLDVSPDCILLCGGAQHALSVAVATACRPNGVVLTEAMTYPGAINLVRQNGNQLMGIDLDGEGMKPEALERALSSLDDAASAPVLYITPTLQNPTATTMSHARRQEIVRISRAYDVTIIEDDVYSIFAEPSLLPIATLAPERTLYVSGLSKGVSPGLRAGVLATPPHLVESALARLQETCTMASPLTCMIMEQWLTDGTALSVAGSIKIDSMKRHVLARKMLPACMQSSDITGFHAWLPMPTAEADRLTQRLATMGVIVMGPRPALTNPDAVNSGIRISIGSPAIADLQQALSIIAGLVAADGQLKPIDAPHV